jgi:hypothetical protein
MATDGGKDCFEGSTEAVVDVARSHRGVLNGESHGEPSQLPLADFLTAKEEVITTCSAEYLVILMLEVLRARTFPLAKLIRPHDTEAQIQRVQFVCTEIRRLFNHPDLFPSPSTRARFAAIISSDGNYQFIQGVKKHVLRQITEEISSFSRANYTRPTYQKGSKGWENFYLNMAPGAPLQDQRLRTQPKSFYQLIPVVGMRIVGDCYLEEQLVAEWIKNVSVKLLENAM